MKSQMLMTISAAALSAAFGLTCAFADPTDNEGGPSGAAGPAAPKMAPIQPGPSSDAGPQSGMSGKDKSAAEAKSGDREQVGEEAQSPGDKSKKAKGTATNKEERGKSVTREEDEHEGKSAEREKDEDGGKSAARDRKDQSGDLSDRHDREATDVKREHREKSVEERSGREDRIDKSAESRDDRNHNARDHKRAQFEARDKEKVRTYFSEHKPNVTRVERDRVRVSLGVAIPTSIALFPLPPGIVVAAGDCPLQYFLWDDDLVIVDSCSREVVDIVPNIG